MVSEDVHTVLVSGSQNIDIITDVHKYLTVPLADKRPAGKVGFTQLPVGTTVQLYFSYTAKRPDQLSHLCKHVLCNKTNSRVLRNPYYF